MSRNTILDDIIPLVPPGRVPTVESPAAPPLEDITDCPGPPLAVINDAGPAPAPPAPPAPPPAVPKFVPTVRTPALSSSSSPLCSSYNRERFKHQFQTGLYTSTSCCSTHHLRTCPSSLHKYKDELGIRICQPAVKLESEFLSRSMSFNPGI